MVDNCHGRGPRWPAEEINTSIPSIYSMFVSMHVQQLSTFANSALTNSTFVDATFANLTISNLFGNSTFGKFMFVNSWFANCIFYIISGDIYR